MKHTGSYWRIYDKDGVNILYYATEYNCPESISSSSYWREWYAPDSEWHDHYAYTSCEDYFGQCTARMLSDVNTVSTYSEPEHEVSFSWKIDPWFILWNGLENGEYYESPTFTTEEGYSQGIQLCFF